MTHLLIWGNTREILAGDLPAGLRADEVRSLAALQSVLDGRSAGVMVLADPRAVEAEREATEAWLGAGGSDKAVIVAVADPADGDEVLRRLPLVDSVLLRPITPLRLRRELERTIDALGKRNAIGQLERAYSRRGEELNELNKIGVALSAERDIDRLLELILSKCREITRADAGSLYLVERAQEAGNGNGDRLRFKLAQNDSVAVSFEEFTVPLDDTSIAGHVALSGVPVNVPDAYHLPEGTPYRISRSFDARSGYRTRSVLVVPMRDHQNLVIGVVQLINKKKDPTAMLQAASLVDEQVVSFSTVDRDLVESLASQAAVAFENADLIRRMRRLFETFVDASVDAIEQRDPTTSGHSRRVAILTVGLIEKVDALSVGPLAELRFTRDQVEEVRYAALLHDFGKVAVQENYLRARLEALQAGRGGDALAAIEAEFERRTRDAERVLRAVLQANEPSVVEEDSFRALMSVPARSFPSFEHQDQFPVEEWSEEPFLSTQEVEVLSIRKGSLSEPERRKIESHVSHTYEFLQKLPWTGDLRSIPEIAWAHHEKLDGTGYPRGLKAPEIRPQSRMMTIADIYDALVAWDRPYKRAVSEERARAILCEEAQAGKVDAELLRVFLEAEIYRLPAFKERLQKKA